MEKKLLTQTGLRKLEEELDDLRKVQRKEIAQKIKEAREQGDLSENAEYDAAKEEQRHIEARIAELEGILKNVEVVEEEIDYSRVHLGCFVTVTDHQMNKKIRWQLVGSTEASSLAQKISNESPIGKALLGSSVGETVTVEAPVGALRFTVEEIEKAE